MATEFTAEERARLPDPGLDVGMSRPTHDRVSSGVGNHLGEVPRALHVVDDIGARVSARDVARKQHHEAIGPDDCPAVGDDAQAVAIAVEGDAQVRIAFADRDDEVVEVRRFGRIRMVVRKAAVDFLVQAHHFAPESFEERRRDQTRHAIAAVDHDRHGTGDGDVGDDAITVLFDDAGRLRRAAGSRRAVAAFDTRTQGLNGIPGKHGAADQHLQSVVLGGVVRSRNHDPRPGIERVGGVVEQRRRNARRHR